jgi:hypothetical protein
MAQKASEMKAKAGAFKQACDKDIQQFCKDVQPGGGRIAKCLKDHQSELSQECKASFNK